MFVEILEYTELDIEKWTLKKGQIRANGIRISLDDYGTGNNNSQIAVRIFEPQEVKVDRSLICNIHQSEEKQEQFLDLLDEFHAQGIHVLAEGVERKEELEFLLTTEVDYLQGFYLGRPE